MPAGLKIASLAAFAAFAALPALAQDEASGQKIFRAQCGACHATEAGRRGIGPTLAGLVGRKSGMVEGFRYSAANAAANLTWDDATLDRYLADPRAVIPGTTMPYAGLRNAEQRADLIAYLKSLK